jgi:para-aminobenzoate synthetase/4-amino-4-deoxychorismate lyase
LRILVAPNGNDGLEAQVERREVPPGGFISIESLMLSGGLGAHKWADRRLLDEAQAELPAGSLPLIIDEDGAVLEASRANVFAVRNGALFTPPLDGRILPGITRMRVLEIAAARGLGVEETELSRDDLLAADEVFLTGSVRGVERANELDRAQLGSGGEVSDRIATELWQAWTGARAAPLR